MIKCASFFAGVGGIDLGFQQAAEKTGLANVTTVYANEFDKYAAVTFKLNFPEAQFDSRDINEVVQNITPETIPEFDIMLAGFPCQAFSIAGYREGFQDRKGRGELFFRLVDIIQVRKPRVIFLENVKNLVSHDEGRTFNVIRGELEKLGYKLVTQVLNACDYGNIPQNRERIYMVAFRDQEDFDKFSMPERTELTKTIKDVIGFDETVDEYYYYSPEKTKFYGTLKEQMKSHDTIYQWRRVYVRENKSNLVPTLTANMGEGGHNVPLILSNDNRIRKITPRECFNVQGYPIFYKLPATLAKSHLYKQAGNSVVVPVIQRIAENILSAICSDTTAENISESIPMTKSIEKNSVEIPFGPYNALVSIAMEDSGEEYQVDTKSEDAENLEPQKLLRSLGMTKEEFNSFVQKVNEINQMINGK